MKPTRNRYLLEALKRMDEGTYGYCKYCGEAIPVECLQRVPGALQCENAIKRNKN